ncbi:MAG: FMN-binding negative transcriptional regulator [Micropepsaceae bacterium]
MYTPQHFQPGDDGAALEAIARWPLAMLVSNGPVITHVPMLREGDRLIGHVALANDHWKRAADGAAAAAVFTGPDAYVSPGFYASKAEHGRVVPTWNYVAVHVHGAIRWAHDAAEKLHIVRTLTDRFEQYELKPWSVDDAPPPFIEAMLRGIVGVTLEIGRIEAQFKLSQNRSEDDRSGVELGLTERGPEGETVARLMRLHLPREG